MGEKYSLSNLLLISIFCFLIIGIPNESFGGSEANNNQRISLNQWKKLKTGNIFIGHRSVGNNLIQGIGELQKKSSDVKITITDLAVSSKFGANGIFHAWVSGDGSPQKIAAQYIHLVDNTLRKTIDIAYLRFTPFYKRHELNAVLQDYKEAYALLKQRYPDTIFLHGTFPLIHSKTTIKTRIKKLLDYDEIWEYRHNLVANKYNELLRKNYGNKSEFFDFAKIQSTKVNGERNFFVFKGKRYNNLVSSYTYDGTHLNEKGRKILAERFLFLVSTLLN